MSPTTATAREAIFARIRQALPSAAVHNDRSEPASAVAREYLPAHANDELSELLAENLADYRAHVHRASSVADLPEQRHRTRPHRRDTRTPAPGRDPDLKPLGSVGAKSPQVFRLPFV